MGLLVLFVIVYLGLQTLVIGMLAGGTKRGQSDNLTYEGSESSKDK